MNTQNIRPAVFLDRDGTIIEDVGHIASQADVQFFPFALDALRILQKHFLLFIVTNQSGVSLGRITRAEADAVNAYVLEHLKSNGINIEKLYCCSHKRDDQCPCIKPKPYFINLATQQYNLDIAHSFSIGDHPHDVEFCKAAGGTGLYVLTGHGEKHKNDIAPGTQCFSDLMAAAVWMTGQRNHYAKEGL